MLHVSSLKGKHIIVIMFTPIKNHHHKFSRSIIIRQTVIQYNVMIRTATTATGTALKMTTTPQQQRQAQVLIAESHKNRHRTSQKSGLSNF